MLDFNYQSLREIFFEHDFFEHRRLSGIILKPTSYTQLLLDSYDLLLINSERQNLIMQKREKTPVGYQVATTIDQRLQLTFVFNHPNTPLLQITDPPDLKAVYLTNVTPANVLRSSLTSGPVVSVADQLVTIRAQKHYYPVEKGTLRKIVLKHLYSSGEIFLPLTALAEGILLDIKQPGPYSITEEQIDGQIIKKTTIYFSDELVLMPDKFGVLDLFLDPAEPHSISYAVPFKSQPSEWLYFLISRHNRNLSTTATISLQLEGSRNPGDNFSFIPVVPSPGDSFDNVIAKITRLDEVNTRQIFLYRSPAPMFLSENDFRFVKLVITDGVRQTEQRLNIPSIGLNNPIKIDDQKYSMILSNL